MSFLSFFVSFESSLEEIVSLSRMFGVCLQFFLLKFSGYVFLSFSLCFFPFLWLFSLIKSSTEYVYFDFKPISH